MVRGPHLVQNLRRILSNMGILRLHFDVNQTILVRDLAGGKSTEDCIRDLISAHTDGKVDAAGNWVYDPSGPVSYHEYVREVKFPLIRCAGTPTEADALRNKSIRESRTAAIRQFLDPGQPGHAFAHLRAPFVKKLLKSHVKYDPSQQWYPDEDYEVLLPSFLRVFDALRSLDFRVVLRTFGSDLPHVAGVMNDHLKQLAADLDDDYFKEFLLEHASSFGFFARYEDTAILAFGHQSPPFAVHEAGVSPQEVMRRLKEDARTVALYEGYSDIYAGIREQSAKHRMLAIQDDFWWWNTHAEGAHDGKLLIVDPAQDADVDIMLDDNVKSDPEVGNLHNIVDVRTVSGRTLVHSEFYDRYACRVFTAEAVMDDDYYVQLVHQTVKNVAAARKQRR